MRKYDVVIIGAGVGGLVCGCYLAKEGLRVLIVEQHDKPGGYCTSFQRKGYEFDVGVHYLGGLKKGILGKTLKELDLERRIEFIQFNPTDKIVLPNNTTYISSDPFETIVNFKKSFPRNSIQIDSFFKFIMEQNLSVLRKKAKLMSFEQLLNEFFDSLEIKSTFNVLLANLGVPASKIAALTAIFFFREFILDPGYYPKNGMQGFSDSLANEFKRCGGDLLLKKKAKKIYVDRKRVTGVLIDERIINTNIVVSNADATETFHDLLEVTNTSEYKIVTQLQPSSSIFCLYLGIKDNIGSKLTESCNIWHSNTYEIEDCLSNLEQNITQDKMPVLMISFPSLHKALFGVHAKSTIAAFINAPYISANFWQKEREAVAERIIRRIKQIVPSAVESIDIKITATPLTLEKYTSNTKGAAYGWAPMPSQSRSFPLKQNTSIEGLILAGHWCFSNFGKAGIPNVASLGRSAARIILTNRGIKWRHPMILL